MYVAKKAHLRLILSENKPHELAHAIAVIVGRSERVLRHAPPRREDDKVRHGHPGPRGGAGEHGEDRRVAVVEGHAVDGVEARQVVLVRMVVAVPCDHVERRVFLK